MTKFTSYLKRTLSLLFLMVAMATTAWGQTPEVTLDFTNAATDWNIPSTATTTEETFTNGTYTITASKGFKVQGKGVLLGKNNATLTLPAFDFDVEKIVLIKNTGTVSGKVTQNIFVGTTAVSTQTTGVTTDQTYEINPDYQNAGTIYILKVTNANNTQFSKIEIYKKEGSSSTKTDPEISFTETDLTVNLGEAFTAPTLTNPYNLTATYSIVSAPAGAIDVNETTGEITINAAGKATVTATTAETEVYKSGVASYTLNVIDPNAKNFELVTDINTLKVGDQLIITSGKSGNVKAMQKWDGNRNNCLTTDVTINSDGTLTEPDANLNIAVLTLGGEKNAWTLFDGTYYLYAAGTSSGNYLKGESSVDNNALATITIGTDENAVITFAKSKAKSNILQYNSDGFFSCYAGTQKNIYLFRKPVATETETYEPATLTLKANSGEDYYATFSNKNVTFFPEFDDDMTFTTEVNKVYAIEDAMELTALDRATATINDAEVEGYIVPANTGVLIKASFNKDNTEIPYYTVTGKNVDELTDNMLYPSSYDMNSFGDGYYFYKLAYDNFAEKTGLGLYWGAENGGVFTSKEGLAYLAVSKNATAKSGFAFDNSTSGIESVDTETSKNDVMYNLAGMRVNNNYKGIVIVNGKKMIRK